MSGGHFGYIQYRINDAVEQMEADLANPDSYANSMEQDIRDSLMLCLARLKEASIRLQRADWLLSGDDGEESYRRRLAEDLESML